MKTKIIYFLAGILFSILSLIVFSQILKKRISSVKDLEKAQENLVLKETYLKNVLKIDSLKLVKLNTRDSIHLNVESDKVTIISQFATWCAPCLREMKGLVALKQNMNDLEVFFISKEDDGVLLKFVKKFPEFENYIYKDADKILDYSRIPKAYLYINGQFLYYHGESANWNNKSNIQFLNQILHEN